jgi:hypothetical protein
MTENWITEFSEWATDLPLPGTTVSSNHHTTELKNKTTSHTVPGKQHNRSPPWFILGVVATVALGIMLLIVTVPLVWWKCITSDRGFYSVAKQNQRTLHNKL